MAFRKVTLSDTYNISILLQDKIALMVEDYCKPNCTEVQRSEIACEIVSIRETIRQSFQKEYGDTFERILHYMLTGRIQERYIQGIKNFINEMATLSSAEQTMFEYDVAHRGV